MSYPISQYTRQILHVGAHLGANRSVNESYQIKIADIHVARIRPGCVVCVCTLACTT